MAIRTLGMIGLVLIALVAPTWAGEWMLLDSIQISDWGYEPSVWEGTVAYTYGSGGAVWLWTGTESIYVFGPDANSFEPGRSPGAIVWRNTMGSASSSEIYYWDGTGVTNLSSTTSIRDVAPSVGSNGDVMWSQNGQWLYYYDASADLVSPLGLQGDHPALYVTDAGVVTYAYQDPDTAEVKYFDGQTTTTLGPGKPEQARCSLWDGCVAWVGEGAGSPLNNSELYFWCVGDEEATRVTDDDDVNGIGDEYPSVWNGVVIWSRAVGGMFGQRLFLYDGEQMVQLNDQVSRYPSYQGGQAAWVASDGLYLADLLYIPDGDCDQDGQIGVDDVEKLGTCMTGPGNGPVDGECGCSDVEGGDADVDLYDFRVLQVSFNP